MTLLKLAGPALILAALVGLCWCFEHRGYERAQAHYEPILAQVRAQAEQATERAKAAEHAAAAINVTITTEDKIRAEDAIRQRDAALTELAGIRVRLASALGRRCEVPSVPTGAGQPPTAPGESAERPERADAALVELGRGCQRDRDRLIAWQDWYRAIAASRSAPPTPPQ